MVMHSVWAYVLAGLLVAVAPASADEALARQRFEQGFLAGKEGHWEEAVNYLEASLAEHEKPATRYNLVLAYHELGRALDVIRHGTAFLREQVDAERAEARARVKELLSAASREVAVLDTSSLPPGARVTIDGTTPLVVDGTLIYVAPGEHVLEVTVAPEAHEVVKVTLGAGHVSSWPRSLPSADTRQIDREPSGNLVLRPALRSEVPSGAATPSGSPPAGDWSGRAAWALGVGGAAFFIAGVAGLWVAEARAHELAQGGIAGTTMPGYLTSAERYRDAQRAVAPFAVGATIAMSAAVALVERLPRRRALVWSIASTLLGAGLLGVGGFFLVREPVPVVPSSRLDRPSRQWGVLLAALGLPFLSYGASSAFRERRSASLIGRCEGLKVTW
jgi:hypothetical protein